LQGVEERLLLETRALHTHKKRGGEGENVSEKIHEPEKKKFEHITLAAKLLDFDEKRVLKDLR